MVNVIAPLYAELGMVADPELESLAKQILSHAPDYFWTAPASSSGKHHSPDENREGGLVLHTRRVALVAYDLCLAFAPQPVELSLVVAGALIHDTCKYGYPKRGKHMIHGHGYLLGQLAYDAGLDPTHGPEVLRQLLEVASTHMGRWDFPFIAPRNPLGILLHTADYLATRSYIRVDVD